MKTRLNLRPFSRRWIALAGLMLLATLEPRVQAAVAPLRLSAQCATNQLLLQWNGALGVKLQRAGSLTDPRWQDVPGSEGRDSMQLPMTNAAAWFRLVDLGLDVDRDELYDEWETNGWTIIIDTSGYNDPAIVEQRHVTSDPALADTDGDGLDDLSEWVLGTDPRSPDTDRDGLRDGEEWFRWFTSPTSVDTDGDARGPGHNLPPNAMLFDGNELRLTHTSPSLDDTDGDGRTDYEEFDEPGRSLLIAEVPRLDVQLVDAVDIRLDVEYAEETGKTFEYGTELSQSTTTSHSVYNENSMEASVTLGFEHTFGLFTGGTKVSGELSVGYGHVWSTTDETANTAESAYSEYSTDSRTRTETVSTGSMSGGVRLINSGPITYTLTDLGVTVRYWMPGTLDVTNGDFRTLATLTPALGTGGITLAPGDSTPVLQVQATGLNASRVKEFMARPNSLYLEPAYYEMENAQGLNFDYLEEITRWRTARVEIDFGDGRNEVYRVATNVERNEDGSYAGVTLGHVMSNILRIPFVTVPRQAVEPASPSNERVLYSVRDVATATNVERGFWVVLLSAEGASPAHANFEDVVLQAGNEILLMFARDEDGDGLFAAEEQHYRTDDGAATDSDGDGLDDVFEARVGWSVVLPNSTILVHSDPSQVDQDGDGLNDRQEFEKGTNPTRPDTDDDGIADGVDPHPTIPAKVLRVKADAQGGDGGSWAGALTNLQDALALARTGLATTTNAFDDVAEIWVASGVYKPAATTNDRNASFELVRNTALYGGFTGVEAKLSQRNPDPLLNGTILSGDLLDNDASDYGSRTNSFADNSRQVCVAGTEVGPDTILDGFMITGGNALDGTGGGLYSEGHPRLVNLLFRANHASFGAGLFQSDFLTAGELWVSGCLFLQNSADYHGGGIGFSGSADSRLVLTNCQFIQNETLVQAAGWGGGGAVEASRGQLAVENCVFSLNSSAWFGGGILLYPPGYARISNSEFRENSAYWGGGGLGVLTYEGGSTVEVVQSVLWGNSTSNFIGGGIWMQAASGRLFVLDSTLSRNSCFGYGGGIALTALTNTPSQGLVENCILWNNTSSTGLRQNIESSGALMRVRTSCLPEANSWAGAGNIGTDPKFADESGGDLRLEPDSSCIDRGNNFIDYFPSQPGFQLLPLTDLDGNWRLLDGNDDGTVTVDMGAYEYR